MPQMGESIAEGTIVKWLKQAGEAVARDEPLFEITTDKVDTEVPAPAAGTLSEILVKEGETVDIGTAVATIAEAGESAPSKPEPPVASSTTEPAPRSAGGPSTPSTLQEGARPAPATEPTPETSDAPGGHFRTTQPAKTVSFRREAKAGTTAESGSPRLSPAVRAAARQAGVSLETLAGLTGSGRGGRVTKRDVERHLAARDAGTASATSTSPAAASGTPPAAYLYQPKSGDERVEMSTVRKRIADHMTWSTRISPHATAIAECDMSNAAALVETAGARFEASVGAPLTYTALVAQAAVKALGEFRTLNASVIGDELILKPAVHLGVAVALPDSSDLIVPVIKEADGLSLGGFAKAVQDLAVGARSRRLTPDDVQGGTFTLTNPGIFGGLTGTPILNQPEVGILGLGAVTKRPVVVDDAIAIRPIMLMSLTFDHRAADGMVAFQYLARVREQLEALPTDLDTSKI
jgi:2-oxoglutarate dehydrogenase E2 component (dihydrolipoamide succinyltransferase)